LKQKKRLLSWDVGKEKRKKCGRFREKWGSEKNEKMDVRKEERGGQSQAMTKGNLRRPRKKRYLLNEFDRHFLRALVVKPRVKISRGSLLQY